MTHTITGPVRSDANYIHRFMGLYTANATGAIPAGFPPVQLPGATEDMRFSIALLPFMRRTHAARKVSGPSTRPVTGLGRALQDTLEWNLHSRERRKRLGLE
jgi:hypothetical protein